MRIARRSFRAIEGMARPPARRRVSLLACVAVLAAPAADATPAASGAAWFLSVGLHESWHRNVRFQPGGGRNADDFVNQPSANVSYSHSGRHRSIALSAGAAAVLFRRLSQFNRLHYTASASGTVQLSSAATFSGQVNSSTSYPFDSQDLADAGLPVPLAQMRTDVALSSLTYQLSRHTKAVADLHYRRTTFDSPVIPGGSYWSGGMTLSRSLGSSDTVSVSSRYIKNRIEGRGGDVVAMTGGWSRVLSRSLSASGSAGALLVRPVGRSAHRLNLSADAGVAAQFRRTTFELHYSRSASQALGLGRDRIGDLVLVRGSRQLTRRMSFRGDFRYGWSRDPGDPSFRFASTSSTAGIGYTLARSLSLAGTYMRRRIDFLGPAPPRSTESVGVSVSYGRALR